MKEEILAWFNGLKKSRKRFVVVLLIMVLIMLLAWIFGGEAEARGYHYPPPPEVTNVTNVSGISSSDLDILRQSIAAAMAAGSCQFDYAPGFQGCGSTWNYDGEWGVNFQVGKRVDDLLFNGGVSCGVNDGDIAECGFGGAVNWHF